MDVTVIDKIIRISEVMEEVRTLMGNKPITVTSWYRDPATNRRVGGASKSCHLVGDAVDFIVAGETPAQGHKTLEPW